MEGPVEIRPARASEADELSALALRSKGYWGYDDDFLEACRAELTYTAEQCMSGAMMVAERAGRAVGFYLLGGTPPVGELLALFVDVDAIGSGIGGVLLRHALTAAGEQEFRALMLDADPDAQPFYVRHGAVRVGEAPSGSIPGRVLPQLRFEL